jgi:hypothetical protein
MITGPRSLFPLWNWYTNEIPRLRRPVYQKFGVVIPVNCSGSNNSPRATQSNWVLYLSTSSTCLPRDVCVSCVWSLHNLIINTVVHNLIHLCSLSWFEIWFQSFGFRTSEEQNCKYYKYNMNILVCSSTEWRSPNRSVIVLITLRLQLRSLLLMFTYLWSPCLLIIFYTDNTWETWAWRSCSSTDFRIIRLVCLQSVTSSSQNGLHLWSVA